MNQNLPKIRTTRKTQQNPEQMSPFELKNNLIALASHHNNKSTGKKKKDKK